MKPFVGWTKSCGDGHVVFAALRWPRSPRRKIRSRAWEQAPVFSNQPNRGWDGEHRNGRPQKPDKRTARETLGSEGIAVRFTGSTTAMW